MEQLLLENFKNEIKRIIQSDQDIFFQKVNDVLFKQRLEISIIKQDVELLIRNNNLFVTNYKNSLQELEVRVQDKWDGIASVQEQNLEVLHKYQNSIEGIINENLSKTFQKYISSNPTIEKSKNDPRRQDLQVTDLAINRISILEKHLALLHQKYDIKQDERKLAESIMKQMRDSKEFKTLIQEISNESITSSIQTESIQPLQVLFEKKINNLMIEISNVSQQVNGVQKDFSSYTTFFQAFKKEIFSMQKRSEDMINDSKAEYNDLKEKLASFQAEAQQAMKNVINQGQKEMDIMCIQFKKQLQQILDDQLNFQLMELQKEVDKQCALIFDGIKNQISQIINQNKQFYQEQQRHSSQIHKLYEKQKKIKFNQNNQILTTTLLTNKQEVLQDKLSSDELFNPTNYSPEHLAQEPILKGDSPQPITQENAEPFIQTDILFKQRNVLLKKAVEIQSLFKLINDLISLQETKKDNLERQLGQLLIPHPKSRAHNSEKISFINIGDDNTDFLPKPQSQEKCRAFRLKQSRNKTFLDHSQDIQQKKDRSKSPIQQEDIFNSSDRGQQYQYNLEKNNDSPQIFTIQDRQNYNISNEKTQKLSQYYNTNYVDQNDKNANRKLQKLISEKTSSRPVSRNTTQRFLK